MATNVDFNSMWNRIATARARHDKEQREREIVEAAEVAKVGVDPLDDIMNTRANGSRGLTLNKLPEIRIHYRAERRRPEGRGRSVNKRTLDEETARIQRGFKRK